MRSLHTLTTVSPITAAPIQPLVFWALFAGIVASCGISAAYDAYLNPQLIFPFDDSYITLHNVRAFLSGFDENFPQTPALIGATSPLHLLLVACASFITPSLEASSFGVAWFSFCGYLLLLLLLIKKRGLNILCSIILILLAATIGKTQYQMLNGLETGAAMVAIVATLYALEFKSKYARAATGFLLGILPALRPELMALSILLLIDTSINIIRGKDNDPEEYRREFIYLSAGLLSGLFPWVVWHYLTTGLLIPTTISAKTVFFAEGCASATTKLRFVANATTNFLLEIGFAALFITGLAFNRRGVFLAVFLLSFIGAYYFRFPGALGHYWYRYWYVLLPILWIGAIELLTSNRALTRNLGMILLIVSLLYSLAQYSDNFDEIAHSRQETLQNHESLTTWIKSHLSKDDVLLVHDIGHIAWTTHNQLIDLVGLKTPRSSAIHKEITYPSCGERRPEAISFIAEYSAAKYLIVLDGWDSIFGITRSIKNNGLELEKVRSGRYSVYRLSRK